MVQSRVPGAPPGTSIKSSHAAGAPSPDREVFMKPIALLIAGAAAAVFLLPAAPAHAIPRTFVSGTGGGAACTRAAPCATFQAAHDATDVNGEINCVDSGEFGPVAINKSITIDCTGTIASIRVVATSGITIAAGATRVRLRGLSIDGSAPQSSVGVSSVNGATLFVENCVMTRMQGVGAGDGVGVRVVAPQSSTARLFVSNSTFTNMDRNGVQVTVNSGGTARFTVDGMRAERMIAGILVNSGGGTVIGQVRNSVFNGNGNGLRIFGAPGNVASITFDRSAATLNVGGGAAGIFVSGASAFAILGRSAVVSNQTGLSPVSGGSILSYQNNHLTGNVTDGAPTALLTMK
jgi:hypothetical protein